MTNKVSLDYEKMREICLAPISHFASVGEERVVGRSTHYFKDNGANILAVAHLDSVQRTTHFHVNPFDDDTIIWNGQLDDRLGAYLIVDFLWRLGLKYDILLTTDEEHGASTGADFIPPEGKNYNWMFEFDRGGVDAVHYQYRDKTWLDALTASGFKMQNGSYSDIAVLDHLGVCGVNVGVGYYDYHDKYAYASMRDMMTSVAKFVGFYNKHKDDVFAYEKPVYVRKSLPTSNSKDDDWWKANKHRFPSTGRHALLPAKTTGADYRKLFDKWDGSGEWWNEDEDEYETGPEKEKRTKKALEVSALVGFCDQCDQEIATYEDEECLLEEGMCTDCYLNMYGRIWSPVGEPAEFAPKDDLEAPPFYEQVKVDDIVLVSVSAEPLYDVYRQYDDKFARVVSFSKRGAIIKFPKDMGDMDGPGTYVTVPVDWLQSLRFGE